LATAAEHHLDMPHMRSDRVRATTEHSLHDTGRAGGGADLDPQGHWERRRACRSSSIKPGCPVLIMQTKARWAEPAGLPATAPPAPFPRWAGHHHALAVWEEQRRRAVRW